MTYIMIIIMKIHWKGTLESLVWQWYVQKIKDERYSLYSYTKYECCIDIAAYKFKTCFHI